MGETVGYVNTDGDRLLTWYHLQPLLQVLECLTGGVTATTRLPSLVAIKVSWPSTKLATPSTSLFKPASHLDPTVMLSLETSVTVDALDNVYQLMAVVMQTSTFHSLLIQWLHFTSMLHATVTVATVEEAQPEEDHHLADHHLVDPLVEQLNAAPVTAVPREPTVDT